MALSTTKAKTKTAKSAAYKAMERLSYHAQVLSSVDDLLDWDRETQMPSGASAIRAEQLEVMAGLIHKTKTSRKWKNSLGRLIDISSGEIVDTSLSEEQQAAAKKWRRDFLKNTAIPDKLVKEFAKITSKAMLVWRSAREENAFNKFAPYLEKIVDLCRRKADLLGYKEHPYDALLDLYEPAMTTATVTDLFSNLKPKLVSLIKYIQSQPQIDNRILYGDFDSQKQLEFGKKILSDMGYDMSKGRLDFSTHPFSSSPHPTDCRITTRIHQDYVLSNIMVILHEGGHALYGMGLPVEHYGSPLGHWVSMGLHESQSRWWETRIGLSKPFWEHYYPLLQKAFPGKFDQVSLDSFYRAANHVEPSFIRVEADEVTYPLHVMLRFELERKLIEGSLKIRDLPEAWNAQMKELLGITPTTNTEGCLQDVHWSMGAFGYFPTYSLGNMFAGQMFEAFAVQFPDWQNRVRQGELSFIRQWLTDNIYKHGRRYDSQEIVEQITHKPFSSTPYANYLDTKYRGIYAGK